MRLGRSLLNPIDVALLRVVLDYLVVVLQFVVFLHGRARMHSVEVSSP